MRLLTIAVVVSALAVTLGCSTEADPAAAEVSAERLAAVQADLEQVVGAGAVGAIATVTENGRTVVLTSGVADRDAKTWIPTDTPQHVRVGSISKTFAATVILQLVAEGMIGLDDPVEKYLPGVLRGEGIDGNRITVRQVLRHQSGLPNFTDDHPGYEYLLAQEGKTATPAELMTLALSRPAEFEPGTSWAYSNTNYIIAGMLVEQVTGHSYTDELNRRILEPLQLEGTYLPGPREYEIRAPHPKGYENLDGKLIDVSRIEPSAPWAAGAMVSTGADLNRFYLALVNGEVLAAAETAQMMNDPVPTGRREGQSYGIGLQTADLPCGTRYFGHSGGIVGFHNLSAATTDGRAITITITSSPDPAPDIVALLGNALCP
ncbi:beta-lactamase family protein [Nocardia cyriacigeorgica]|uniref:Beta-lactamase family protein n=1 Tax=Nocardia cyriacigeorgica TaxID=135487 RepID=A0A6P1D6T3_9NOCA|nr:serine hydrolase domain-containing protein [Nocardia cyriacigeorgica]NEW41865.1 beta-lactamase family protein [Nocardia cyriacigeorgica]NEW46157.1 beta-lactamase family protein [Nocardia cyriacigeorgica]NEW52229.1 beta-lactamase family protein [Nocardia cyriacigeorgica]NEW57613.1 beta-lactamase family protein [Nocardia cyriacigeorgica]